MIQQILSPEMIQALGWTLVHSLWQAAVFAVGLGLVLIALRKFSARARYNVAISFLVVFFLAVIMTFSRLYVPAASVSDAKVTPPAETSAVIAGPEQVLSSTANAGLADQAIPTTPPAFRERVTEYYNHHLPLIVTLWLMGVLILQLRFLGQLAFLQRLKNYGMERFPARFAPLLQELETALNVSKPVRYLSSFRVASPYTSGWWRPVVLFPATLLAELNEPELRTIMAHELAHVKRHDFLVNLAQTLVCILFFYHPAVWWMSSRIEDEREHCCDDLAIAVTGERVGYARTLVRLKEQESAPAMAMAFLGKGGFKQRVTRLLSGYLGTGTYGEGFTSAVIIAVIMGLAVSLSAQDQTPRTTDLPPSVSKPEPIDFPANELPVASPQTPVPPESPTPPTNITSRFEAEAEMDLNQSLAGLSDSTALRFFFEAIDDGNVELTRYFLKQGVDVNAVDDRGWTPLMVAADENKPQIARLLITAGADVNFVNRDGWTALIEAADEGSYETARVLLNAGADVNLSGSNNDRTALAMAASEGHARMITLLVGAGADINSLQGGNVPLHEAAEEGQLHIVKALVNRGADAGARDGRGRGALSYAAEEGKRDVVAYLLNNGANPNDSDDHRRTALSYAAEEGETDIVVSLLAAGARPEPADDQQRTALSYAAEEGKTDIVTLLLETGVGYSGKDMTGRTPIDYAAWELIRIGAASINYSRNNVYDPDEVLTWKNDGEGLDEVIRILSAKGALNDFVTVDGQGNVRLTYGAIRDSGYDEKLDRQRGSSYRNGSWHYDSGHNNRTDHGTHHHTDGDDDQHNNGEHHDNDFYDGYDEERSPLIRVLSEGEHRALARLLEQGAEVQQSISYRDTDFFGRTPAGGGGTMGVYSFANPLMLAITEQDKAAIGLLLKNGADVNAPCRKARYLSQRHIPWQEAENMRPGEMASRFTTAYNVSGWTPLMEAVEADNPAIVQILLGAGANVNVSLTGGLSARSLAQEIGNQRIIDMLR